MKTDHMIAGRYQVQQLINRGGMGDVYRGLDTQTGRAVAIKTLSSEVLLEDPSLLERFRREASVLRKLDHPNIVKILDTVDEAEQHHIIMEFISGGSLAQRIADEGKLPVRWTVQTAIDLSDALTRAHRLNIIHRDIKSSNVMLAEDGSPRLTDFGVAQIGDTQTRLTRKGALLGTLAYLAPELCSGGDYSELTDIWSFGVVLYEMLTGHLPFRGERPAEVVSAILNEPVSDVTRYRDQVPEALNALIMRMLEKDPSLRIDSSRSVGAELEQIIRQMQIPVEPPPAPPAIPAPIRMTETAAPPASAEPLRQQVPDEPCVFIVYRREDTGPLVDQMVERMQQVFGRERVLRDIDRLSLRTISRLVLASDILASCTHVLVVMGQHWLKAGESSLENPKDIVRVELESALKRTHLQIVPVLLDNVSMPAAQQLPEALQGITRYTPFSFAQDNFDASVRRLIRHIQGKPETQLPWQWMLLVALAVIAVVALILLTRPL